MADEQRTLREEDTAKDAGTRPPRGDVTEGHGGKQSDQISGETDEGARNNETQNRNPQGNPPDRT